MILRESKFQNSKAVRDTYFKFDRYTILVITDFTQHIETAKHTDTVSKHDADDIDLEPHL